MSQPTVYTVQSVHADGVEDLGSRSRRQAAEKLANELFDGTTTVQVVTAAGNVLLSLAARGKRFAPWTRTETVDAPAIAGFTPAYTRNRVGAVVYRANDKSGWLVVTADSQVNAANTAEARAITNQLAADHRDAVAQDKAEAKAARAVAKAEVDAERLAKREAKAADKAAKAAAKAAKEAEVAA